MFRYFTHKLAVAFFLFATVLVAGPVYALDAPTGVNASDGDYTDKIVLTWNAVSGAEGYNIYVATSTTGHPTYDDYFDSTSSTSYEIPSDTPGLIIGQIYYFWVEAWVWDDYYQYYVYSPVSSPDSGYVGNTNPPPTISGTPPSTAVTGQLYSFTPTADDPDDDTLTFSITNKPDWASFNTTTGELSGTPSNTGTHTGIVISVTDGVDGHSPVSLPEFSIEVVEPLSLPIPSVGQTEVSAGEWHVLYLKSDGTVTAWGKNWSGAVGDGTTNPRPSPVPLSLSNIVYVSAGYSHSLALKNDGTVWTWGDNDYGQLGDNNTADRTSPYQLTGLPDIVAISAGFYHNLALTTTGTVWVWGDNEHGQLGDNTTTLNRVPKQVSGLSNVVGITAGGSHSLALKQDGTLWVWGNNDDLQLNGAVSGTPTNSKTPVQVSGISNIASMSTGTGHVVILKNDGTVWVWGRNDEGQLGDGGTNDDKTPTQVTGLPEISAISTGAAHNMALDVNGFLWVWGDNYYGQLCAPAPAQGGQDSINTPTKMTDYPNVTSTSNSSIWKTLMIIQGEDGLTICGGGTWPSGGILQGIVKSDQNLALSGANVIARIGGAVELDLAVFYKALSATDGSFSMPLPEGLLELIIRKDGWQDHIQDVTVTADQTLDLGDITLSADVDTDNDGLTDSQEAQLGTNPQLADTDADGLSDDDEVNTYTTDPLKPDTDDDGYSDKEEVDSGTNPKDANDFPRRSKAWRAVIPFILNQ